MSDHDQDNGGSKASSETTEGKPTPPTNIAATDLRVWPLPGMVHNQRDPGTPFAEISSGESHYTPKLPPRTYSDASQHRCDTPPQLPPRPGSFSGSMSRPPLELLNISKFHSMSLAMFASTYSKQLPARIEVMKGFYGSSNKRTISGQERLVVQRVRRSEVFRIKSNSEKMYSIPYTSNIQFSLLYSPHEDQSKVSGLDGVTFESVANMKGVPHLPKVVCVTREFHGKDKTSLSKNELLVIDKLDSVSNKLHVTSVTNGLPKELPLECNAGFTTKPDCISLYLSDIIKFVHTPEHAIASLDLSNLPKSDLQTINTCDKSLLEPVMLMERGSENSLVACLDKPGGDHNSLQSFEIPLDESLPVEVTVLEVNLPYKGSSNVDPTQLKKWGVNNCSEDIPTAQHIFSTTLRPGTSIEMEDSPDYEDIQDIDDGHEYTENCELNTQFHTETDQVFRDRGPSITSPSAPPIPDKMPPLFRPPGQISPMSRSTHDMHIPDSPHLSKEVLQEVLQDFLAKSVHRPQSRNSVENGEPCEVGLTSPSREKERLSDLCDIVSELVECEGLWYYLSIYIGVPKSKVDQIVATYSSDPNLCRRGLLEGVSYWLDNMPNPTWSSITSALYKLEKRNVARRIAEKYGAVLPNPEPADSLEDPMPVELNEHLSSEKVKEVKRLQKQMLEKSEELNDVNVNMFLKGQVLDRLKEDLDHVRKKLLFNEEYTQTLTYSSQITECKKAKKEGRLQSLEISTDSSDVSIEAKELKTSIVAMHKDLATYNNRLQRAADETTELQKQLMSIEKKCKMVTRDLYRLHDQKCSLSLGLRQQEVLFNKILAGNHSSPATPSPEATDLESRQYYNVIIHNGKVQQLHHEKEAAQLQEDLQEKDDQLQKLNARLQQAQATLANVERKLICQQSGEEYWYTEASNDLVQNENLRANLQAEKVDCQLQIATTRLSKKDVEAKLDTRKKTLLQTKKLNEQVIQLQAKATQKSRKSNTGSLSHAKHSTSSEDDVECAIMKKVPNRADNGSNKKLPFTSKSAYGSRASVGIGKGTTSSRLAATSSKPSKPTTTSSKTAATSSRSATTRPVTTSSRSVTTSSRATKPMPGTKVTDISRQSNARRSHQACIGPKDQQN